MRKHRWVKTEFTPNGGLSIVFKYGTTSCHTSLAILYSGSNGRVVFPMMYQHPALKKPLVKELALESSMPPREVNKMIWAALRSFERECSDKDYMVSP